jgi:two-component system LytT family response regulator
VKLRVMIADDEAPARRKLARFLAAHDDVEVVAEASTGLDAVDLIAMTKPDIAFLDVQMPDLDGVGVARELVRDGSGPQIVFVTAFDEFAVKAFEVRALDYLLKPYDRARFDEALDRARRALRQRSPSEDDFKTLLAELRKDERYTRRVLVNDGEKSLLLAVGDVARFEADGNHVVVHAKRGTYRVRATLESLVDRLDPEQFARVHRSHAVRIENIAEIVPWFHGDYKLRLVDGTELTWSRRYAAQRKDLIP